MFNCTIKIGGIRLFIKGALRYFLNILRSRRLILALSFKDFKKRYAGSYFGAIWAFITPIMTVVMYLFVFQIAFPSGAVYDIPFLIWFTAGIVPWFFISDAISSSSSSLLEYNYLVKKVIFNIDILPIVKVLSSFIVHLAFVLFVIIMAIAFGFYPSLHWFQMLYYMLCSIVMLFSISLITSSIMIFFRDLGQIINIILMFGFWFTPISWNVDMIPAKYQFIFKASPFYYIVNGFRDSLLRRIWFWDRPAMTLTFWGIIAAFMFVGLFLYKRLKPHFSDVL